MLFKVLSFSVSKAINSGALLLPINEVSFVATSVRVCYLAYPCSFSLQELPFDRLPFWLSELAKAMHFVVDIASYINVPVFLSKRSIY